MLPTAGRSHLIKDVILKIKFVLFDEKHTSTMAICLHVKSCNNCQSRYVFLYTFLNRSTTYANANVTQRIELARFTKGV